MSAEVRGGQWSRLAIGIVILSAGVIFWLDQIDRINARDYIDWWPLALIAIGLAHLPERKWAAGLIWIAAGSFFLLPMLGYDRPSIWLAFAVWPLLISVAGMTLVIQALQSRDRLASGDPGFRAVAVMAGNVRRLSTPTSGGDITAVMGGCEVKLTEQAMRGKEMVIDVLAFWGGIEIVVPRSWIVIDHVAAILGGLDNRTARPGEGAPRVIVRGSAIMGGIEIRNPREKDA